MQKLKLDLEALAVESFEPAAAAGARAGPVPAREMAPTAPYCSYIDACVSRLCTPRC
jgi:hypothetical protein